MTITFQKEFFAAIMPELPEIWYTHFSETPDGHLDPDWSAYLRMELLGALHIITARDKEKIVGYFFAIIQHHLHDKGLKVAYVDLWYILPEYRKDRGGILLLKKGEEMLKQLGVGRIGLSVPVSSNMPFLSGGLGYNLSERAYRKTL